jgi:hypothetical protein
MGMDNKGIELSELAEAEGISCKLAITETKSETKTIIENIFFRISADRYSVLSCFYFFANTVRNR